MLIVPGDSWFFAKLLTGGRLYKINGGTALRILRLVTIIIKSYNAYLRGREKPTVGS